MQRAARLKKELALFEERPPPGISCYSVGDDVGRLEAQIVGGDATPYKDGIFKLQIDLPNRFPFEPPIIRFLTPIYHPNIDTSGRICLDLLKMPPVGTWSPVLQLGTVLTSIQLLMAEPNPDDPLMADIAQEFKYSRQKYEQAAVQWTKQHAMVDKQQEKVDDPKSNDSAESNQDPPVASPSEPEENVRPNGKASTRLTMTLNKKRPAINDSDGPLTTENKIPKL